MNTFQQKIVERAERDIHKLSSWECDFIESLNLKSDDYVLTEKQNHILNRISEKV